MLHSDPDKLKLKKHACKVHMYVIKLNNNTVIMQIVLANFIMLSTFLSPEASLLLVSTKNHNLEPGLIIFLSMCR